MYQRRRLKLAFYSFLTDLMRAIASPIAAWMTVTPDAFGCCCCCCLFGLERLRLVGAPSPAPENGK